MAPAALLNDGVPDNGVPHRIGLDAVRALAIGMVLVCHCGAIFSVWYARPFPPGVARLGYLGVGLFFVLSGFLIGRLLLEILAGDGGPRAWITFMTRRWLRTLPLYYAWMLFLGISFAPRYWIPGRARLFHDLPWFITLTQNLGWPMVDDWFSVSWSLTVEEWFYLLFSALLLGAAAILGRTRALALVLAVFLLMPLAARLQLPPGTDWNEVTSKIVLYRLDAIAFGVIAACIWTYRPHWMRHHRLLLILGITILVVVWSQRWNEVVRTPVVWRNALVFDMASIGFALCLPAAMAATWQGRWTDALRAVARQSYGMYIMHMSVLEMVSYFRGVDRWPNAPCVVLAIACIAVLPYVSWTWFERPILALRPRQAGLRPRFRIAPVGAHAIGPS